jgi:hypothetical protein
MSEYRIPLHIPLIPLRGEPIDVGNEVTAVGRQFARVRIGEDRFVVLAANRHVYEVVPVASGSSRRWRVTAARTRVVLNEMGPNETKEQATR